MPGSYSLETRDSELTFDQRGRLMSFVSKDASDQNFVITEEEDPVFVIQYLDRGDFHQISSNQAERVDIELEDGGERTKLVGEFKRIGGKELNVEIEIGASETEKHSIWSLSVANSDGLSITDVQFPFVVVRYDLDGTDCCETLVRPFFRSGELMEDPEPWDLEPDDPTAWQFQPGEGLSGASHYPGLTFAQFLAYYNDRAGVYLSSRDASGAVKAIKPVHHGDGIRLGISHIGDWPRDGRRELEYDVVLGSFVGDWYDAADLYREWSLQQHWAETPLLERTDVPSWLLESPPHIIVRLQGLVDAGPTEPNGEFLPYRKLIPLLEDIADYVEAPLVPILMSWENHGPWVYPNSFPPVGGTESMEEFAALARDRGWHVGSFGNGTRWVTRHKWSGYDGRELFESQGGPSTVCKDPEGDLWKNSWSWRSDYLCCMGVEETRELAGEFADELIDTGLDWIQFLDQNVGCSTFPCFAEDHDHPPYPGRWMTEDMERLIESFHERAEIADNRNISFSVECPPNEYFLQHLQACDVRVIPPGHRGPGRYRPDKATFIPLFQYLYHEFIVIQGGFGSAPEPHHLPIRNAYNLVIGEIPGGVLKGDGKLLNKDTFNWAPWEPQVGDNEDSLRMLRAATELRRNAAEDFLVYGRMIRPPDASGIQVVNWQRDGRDHAIPAVFRSAWESLEDGRVGFVFANWTSDEQRVTVNDPHLKGEIKEVVSGEDVRLNRREAVDFRIDLEIPPLSCVLLVANA